MLPETTIIIKSGKIIQGGSIYMVDAVGNGKIFGPQNESIDSF